MTNQPIEEKWKIDKEVYKILSGGIISIVDTTDGKKIVGIASASEVITDFIENILEQERERMSEEIEKLRKEKTADRQLIHFDHTVEHIKYYESDSDPAFNKALDKVLSIINK